MLYALNLKNIKKTKNKKQLPLIIIIINIALNLDADPQAQAKRRYTLLFTHFIDYNFPYSLYNIMIIITIKADTCELHSVQRPEVPDNLRLQPNLTRDYTLFCINLTDYNFLYSLYNIIIMITINADTCELHSVQRPEVPDNLAYSPTSPETILFSVLI